MHQYDTRLNELQAIEEAFGRGLIAHYHGVGGAVVLAGDILPGRAVELTREVRQR
jgi:hypothetical protein